MPERRRFKQEHPLRQRLEARAVKLRADAEALAPGPERERLLKLARQAEEALAMDKLLAPDA